MNYNNLRKAASLTMLGILSLSTLGGNTFTQGFRFRQ